MPTLVEQWLERGRTEGLRQGLEQGREQGRDAARTLLRRYLATRFEVQLDAFDEALLAGCDLETLTQLSQVAFEANTLAEFEAALGKLTANQTNEQNGDANPEK